MTNIRPLQRRRSESAHATLLRDMDTVLADIALDNPDLEPPGMHQAIRNVRTRYRAWLAHQARHPSAGPGGGAA